MIICLVAVVIICSWVDLLLRFFVGSLINVIVLLCFLCFIEGLLAVGCL